MMWSHVLCILLHVLGDIFSFYNGHINQLIKKEEGYKKGFSQNHYLKRVLLIAKTFINLIFVMKAQVLVLQYYSPESY